MGEPDFNSHLFSDRDVDIQPDLGINPNTVLELCLYEHASAEWQAGFTLGDCENIHFVNFRKRV
jgi:hypothetical protein